MESQAEEALSDLETRSGETSRAAEGMTEVRERASEPLTRSNVTEKGDGITIH